MGFNISGLVLNKNFEENFEDLQIVLGWNLEKQSIIDFETASSNWKESGICDVLFSSKGTLIFLNMDLCTDPFPVRNANTFTFALSETSMAFNLNFCEDGLEKRSIMEVHGKRIRNSGKPLSVEAKSDDTPDIVWNQIEMMLGKSYWSIPPDEKVVRYKFVKGKKKINQSTYYDKVDSNGQTKLQKIQSNPPRTLNDVYAEKQKIKTKEKVTDNGSSFSNEKIAGNRISHEPRKKWWMFWQKDSKQDQTKVSIVPQPTTASFNSKRSVDSSSAIKNYNPYVEANAHPLHVNSKSLNHKFFNLKGDVKKISIHEFKINKDSSKGEYSEGKSYFFNNEHKIEHEWWHTDNKRIAVKIFYRDYQNMIKDKVLYFDKNNENHIGEWYFYEDDLLIREENLRDGMQKVVNYKLIKESDGIYLHGKHSIDKYVDGKLMERNIGNGRAKHVYGYHNSGTIKRYEYYNQDFLESKKEFNESGGLVLSLNNDYKDGALVESRLDEIQYSKHGLRIEMQETLTSQKGKKTNTTKYLYENGSLVSVVRGLFGICGYKYNDNGDLIESFFAGKTDTFEYLEYDTQGNWLSRIEFHENKPVKYIERDIEYFKSDSLQKK